MKLEGFTKQSRHGVTFEVMESVQACGGAILDHQQYSNQVLRLSIEIRGERLLELVEGVEAAGVSLSQTSIEQAQAMSRETSDTRIAGTLVIRFVSDEPDLRIRVPAIPG